MSKKTIYLVSFFLVLSMVSSNVLFGIEVIERRISAGSDDGEEAVNEGFQGSYNTSSDLEMLDDHADNGGRQFIGMNFRDISIAPGSEISSAYIELVCDETKDGSEDAYLLIWGHLAANPDLVSFPGQGADPLVGATEHGTPDLAFLIFEREIPVPGGWSGKAGEFPLNPDLHKA